MMIKIYAFYDITKSINKKVNNLNLNTQNLIKLIELCKNQIFIRIDTIRIKSSPINNYSTD